MIRFLIKTGVILFGILVGIGAIVLSSSYLTKRAEPYVKDAALIAGLNTAAINANLQGPRMVDTDTKFERAEVGPGPMMTYHFSLPNHPSSKVDIQSFGDSIRTANQQSICGNAKMLPSIRDGAIYVYVYSSADQVEIVRFEINKKICRI